MGLKRWIGSGLLAYAAVWGIGSWGAAYFTGKAMETFAEDDPLFAYAEPEIGHNPLRIGATTARVGYAGAVAENLGLSISLLHPLRPRLAIGGPVVLDTNGAPLTAKTLWAELQPTLTPRMDIKRAHLNVEKFAAGVPLIGAAKFDAVLAATPQTYDIALGIDDLSLDTFPALQLAQSLPQVISHIGYSGQVTLNTLPALRESTPVWLEGISFFPLALNWGDTTITANGTLTADPRGLAEGRLELEITGWATFLRAAADLGLIDQGVVAGYIAMGTGLANADGVVAVPLVFADGLTKLGPFPVGPAPVLAYRQ